MCYYFWGYTQSPLTNTICMEFKLFKVGNQLIGRDNGGMNSGLPLICKVRKTLISVSFCLGSTSKVDIGGGRCGTRWRRQQYILVFENEINGDAADWT